MNGYGKKREVGRKGGSHKWVAPIAGIGAPEAARGR